MNTGKEPNTNSDLGALGMDFSKEVIEAYDDMVAIRRDLHQFPELGGEEERTPRIVRDELVRLGIEVKEDRATGVEGLISGKKPGRVVLVRGDMDALPVFEENDLPYKSKIDGIMHACGHDAHTAMLLVLARIIKKRGIEEGALKLMFQPAEEGGDGAAHMIEEGVLENPTVDAALAFHVWTPFPVGEILAEQGAQAASVDGFKLTVYGKGTHGARPEEGIDPIVIASHIITASQALVTRLVPAQDPAVLSFTAVNAGNAFNIIPQKAEILGTFRTFNETVRSTIKSGLVQLASALAGSFGGRAEYESLVRNAPVVNDSGVAATVQNLARDLVGSIRLRKAEPLMVGEDFGEILRRVPGALILIGAGSPESGALYPHHHPRFNIDERAMAIGVELGLRAVYSMLKH